MYAILHLNQPAGIRSSASFSVSPILCLRLSLVWTGRCSIVNPEKEFSYFISIQTVY